MNSDITFRMEIRIQIVPRQVSNRKVSLLYYDILEIGIAYSLYGVISYIATWSLIRYRVLISLLRSVVSALSQKRTERPFHGLLTMKKAHFSYLCKDKNVQLMLKVCVQPTLEINKWSLYHNSNLSTNTVILDEKELDLSVQITVKELSHLLWSRVDGSEFGFKTETNLNKEDKVIWNGIHLMSDKRLSDYNIEGKATFTIIRRIFVVQGESIPNCIKAVLRDHSLAKLGWKMLTDPDYDSSTDEDSI